LTSRITMAVMLRDAPERVVRLSSKVLFTGVAVE
jgi:hypothetical protein